MLDENQKIVAESYCAGEYAYVENPRETVGDSLFTFLMAELSHEQDCVNKEEASKRLSKIIQEIKGVRAAFEKLA